MGFIQKIKQQAIMTAATRSPWVFHFNASSCNGCDIEILDILTPRHDVERFGIVLKGGPRQADAMVITGPVGVQNLPALKRVWAQMPAHKFCIVVGTCGISGGVFKECYNTLRGVNDAIGVVHAMVQGCPPRPDAIITGVVALLNTLPHSPHMPKEEKK